jgi:cell division protein FtsQ
MKTQAFWGLATVLVLILAAYFFSMLSGGDKMLKNLTVNIESGSDTSHFIGNADIKKMITEQLGKQLSDVRLDDLDTKALERTLRENMFVAECHVSKDVAGNLVVDIRENKPLARILTNFGKGGYLAENGEVLPLSERSTARVLMICGRGSEKMLKSDFWKSETGQKIFKFLDFIEKNEFLKAQVAEVHFDEHLNAVLFPHIGDERIEIGMPDNFQKKFENLMVYYKKIVPFKGWQAYKNINLKIDNQIICK